MCASGKENKANRGKQVLARDEKLISVVRESSTHKGKESIRPSWDTHSCSRGTHDLEGLRARHLSKAGSVWEKPTLYRHVSLGQ